MYSILWQKKLYTKKARLNYVIKESQFHSPRISELTASKISNIKQSLTFEQRFHGLISTISVL